MRKIDNALGGCGVNCAGEFQLMFSDKVIKPVMDNPNMLRKKFWME